MTGSARTPSDIRRWRRYLADERAEATTYRELARRRTGEEHDILLRLAEAEGRHEAHWLELLGDDAGPPSRSDLRTRVLGALTRRFGFLFALALVQRSESRTPYDADPDAPASMAADERIHSEVVRGLAARGRSRLSGTFRAAVFGANDGLVSNLSLILGVAATRVPTGVVLITGVAGLLAGALSMGAGEYVSVRSQRELLEASAPDPGAYSVLPQLDIDRNEVALVFRSRGMSEQEAAERATDVVAGRRGLPHADAGRDAREAVGTGLGAALSSFAFFASGALVPVLPYLFGAQGLVAVVIAAALVGIALLGTGAIVGLLSGASPVRRGLRQLAIGYGAAAITYLLGLLLGAATGAR